VRLKALALGLQQEGRSQDALCLWEQLAPASPKDPEILRHLAKGLSAEGRVLEAIEALLALKAATTDMEGLLDDIRAVIDPALQCFNLRAAAGENLEAERIAAALATLIPGNAPILEAALNCNLALGRSALAVSYATRLLSVTPGHAGARSALESLAPAANSIEQQVARALAPAAGVPPLLRLRDLHDAVSALLCRELNARAMTQLAQLLEASAPITINARPGTDWPVWEKHYRLMLQAIDLPAVRGATPPPAPEPELDFATAQGASFDWSELAAIAERLGPQAVFFAAADRGYVDLYARWYIMSILKNCDVPCLVIVHAIGGAEKLAEIAQSLGISDHRLVFSGDRFDADSVTTRCHDAPPKGLIAKPVAHFQSVRFLRLGALLQRLGRPIFVSDIDLLLQRGVDDLLQRCAGADVVLNENLSSPEAGSRYTANLVLLNPTENARLFARFLRDYLERMLARPEVTRWIDQFGLLLARHHLLLRGNAPRLAYFDTRSDINNVMYKTFQKNPFRFLSLYHGFDTSSLEEPGTGPAPVRVTRAEPAPMPAVG
jgi:hypothetical protein